MRNMEKDTSTERELALMKYLKEGSAIRAEIFQYMVRKLLMNILKDRRDGGNETEKEMDAADENGTP